jgi:hypothetical protein
MNELEKSKSLFRKKYELEKKVKLFVAILIDLFGCFSYLIPGSGEIFDLAIAPISAILVFVLFGRKLKWAAFTFIEELIPMTDVIPSATIAWYSMYVTNELETISEMDKQEKLKQKMFDNLDRN